MYYGTELGFTGEGGGFGEGGRIDFPGGWASDDTNLFEASDRNERQKDLHQFVRKLANFRKNSPALTEGKLVQFVPKNGIYVYFRHADQQRVMVLFNGSSKPQSVDLSPYGEQLAGYQWARNIITEERMDLNADLKLEGKASLVLLLE